MNTDLVLVAASGLARETLEAARAQGRYRVIGLLDDDPSKHGEGVLGVPILGGVGWAKRFGDASFVICAGKGSARQAIAERLALPASRYATVVDPSVSLPVSCAVGAGAILLAGCVLTASVTVGRHVVAMPNVTLTHDDLIDDFVTLCAGVTLGGSVTLGTRAYLGMRSSVREDVWIGPDTTIGMGAVVLRDVPRGQTWVGTPARQISISTPRVKT